MRTEQQPEARAVARLIAQIDSIDAWRDRTGRRILGLCLVTFAVAIGLLIWTMKQAQFALPAPHRPPGEKVPAVLQRLL